MPDNNLTVDLLMSHRGTRGSISKIVIFPTDEPADCQEPYKSTVKCGFSSRVNMILLFPVGFHGCLRIDWPNQPSKVWTLINAPWTINTPQRLPEKCNPTVKWVWITSILNKLSSGNNLTVDLLWSHRGTRGSISKIVIFPTYEPADCQEPYKSTVKCGF